MKRLSSKELKGHLILYVVMMIILYSGFFMIDELGSSTVYVIFLVINTLLALMNLVRFYLARKEEKFVNKE